MLLHDAIPKSKSPKFRSSYESKKTPVMGKAKVMEADRNLFQRLFVAKSSGRTVYLAEKLWHELFPVPLSQVSYTTFRKLHVLEKGVTVETLPASEEKICTTLDDQALGTSNWKTKVREDIWFSSTCLSYLKKLCTRVDVVFD